MARKKESSQKTAMREMMRSYFKENNISIKNGTDVNAILRDIWKMHQVTKSKTVFSTDVSLLKMLYPAMMDITKKWTRHRQNRGQIHFQLEIYFEDCLSGRNL